MRIAFAGTPEVAIPVLDAVLAAGYEVAFVITREDAPAGRGRTLTPSPVAVAAQAHGLEVIKTSKLQDVAHQVSDVDAVVVVAFGAMVTKELLELPRYGWINLHFSLLPHWRGAAPVQHTIMAGDDVTGVTTFRIDEGLDTGDVLGQITTSVKRGETSGELLTRLSHEGAQLMVATLAGLANGAIVPTPQPNQGVSYAPKITKDDARIDWTMPALAIERRIRAMTPQPGAWTLCNGERLKVFPVQIDEVVKYLAPGEVQVHDGQLLVGTGSHVVALDQVQQAGRSVVSALEWARNNAGVVLQ